MINELSPKLRKHTLTLEKNNANNIVTDRKTNKNSKYFVHGMVDTVIFLTKVIKLQNQLHQLQVQ